MVIVGLLLIALVCLIVGLVLPNTAWLLASLIASAGAGYLLWRSRATLKAAHAGSGGEGRSSAAVPADRGDRVTVIDRDDADGVDDADSVDVDGSADLDSAPPAADADSADTSETTEFAAVSELLEPPDEPNQPDAVAGTAPLALAEPERMAEPEPVAEAESVAEREPEPVAEPEPEPVAEPEPEPVSAAASAPTTPAAQYVADDGDVWVIDGRPRYHLAHCAIIQGQDAEPIPFEQATEDGFMPCSLCEPNALRAG